MLSTASRNNPAPQLKTPSPQLGRRRTVFAVPPNFRAHWPGVSADHHHGRGSVNGEPLRPGLLGWPSDAGHDRSAGDSRGMFGRSSVSDSHQVQTRWTARGRLTRLDHGLYYLIEAIMPEPGRTVNSRLSLLCVPAIGSTYILLGRRGQASHRESRIHNPDCWPGPGNGHHKVRPMRGL